jgi:hypothetical protein
MQGTYNYVVPKKTVFLGYPVMQLHCGYSLWHM